MRASTRLPLALVGPTASGKTEASLLLAEALGAEIVCVDSMLVYRGMDAGTAKPSPQQRARVPHHLVDLVGPGEPFSVAAYQASARLALQDIDGRGTRPLLVGGTGLYFRAVVDGLEFPGTRSETRRLLQAEASLLGPAALHRRLSDFDPAAAEKIEPQNARRTVRALEVAAITGRAFSSFARRWDRYPVGRVRAAGVSVAREELNRRIERRVEGMMPGLVAETDRLLRGGYGPFLTSGQAIGYAEAAALLGGTMTEEEAIARTVRRTKALARRQMAWFRRDPRIRWFEAGEEGALGIVDDLRRYLEGRAARSARPAAARSAG